MPLQLLLIPLALVYANSQPDNTGINNVTCLDGCICGGADERIPIAEDTFAGIGGGSKPPKQWTILKTDKYAVCDGRLGYNIREVFSKLPDDIEALVLRDGNTTTLMDVCCLNELRYLDLSRNRINDVLAYYQFEKVVNLNLQSNDLRLLRKEEFMSFPNVEILNLDDNNIRYVDQEAFRLMNLRRLILSRNKIAYINERSFRFMPFLETLDVAGNRLISLQNGNFFYSKKLKYLDLSHNQLVHIDVEVFEPLERIEVIDLAYNNLTDLPSSAAFAKLPFLKQLTFDGNPLETLPRGALYSLNIQTLYFNEMPNLKLVLAGALTNLTNLRKLSFDNSTRLTFVSNEALQNMTSLKEISFNNCSLIVLPTTFGDEQWAPSLERIEVRENPLSCECMNVAMETNLKFWQQKIQYPERTTCFYDETTKKPSKLFDPNARKSVCKTRIIPSTNVTFVRTLGASVSLFCIVLSGYQYTTKWIGPDSVLLKPNDNDRFQITDEQLYLVYSLLNDSGRYRCYVNTLNDNTTVSRYIDLEIENPNIGLTVEDVSSQWVYLRWNKSASDMGYGEYLLEYSIRTSDVLQRSYLPTVATTFRIADLKPQTNYTFCLIYRKMDDVLYRRCIEVETTKRIFGFGVTLNYGLIAIVASSVSLVCAFCVVRCLHKRFHIWQEEKYRGRLQETMSAQGFLSSFESLSSGNGGAVAITYENPGAFEALSDREEETSLNLGPNGELLTDRSLISKEAQRKRSSLACAATSTTVHQHEVVVEPSSSSGANSSTDENLDV